MDFVSWKDHKPLVTALEAIYRAVNAQAVEQGADRLRSEPMG
jgi:hypothetical protein